MLSRLQWQSSLSLFLYSLLYYNVWNLIQGTIWKFNSLAGDESQHSLTLQDILRCEMMVRVKRLGFVQWAHCVWIWKYKNYSSYLNYWWKKKSGDHSGNQYKRFRVTSQRKLGREQKIGMKREGEGEGKEETLGRLRVTMTANVIFKLRISQTRK